MQGPDLEALDRVLERLGRVIDHATGALAREVAEGTEVPQARLDTRQLEAYQLATLVAEREAARALALGAHASPLALDLAQIFLAETVARCQSEMELRPGTWRAGIDLMAETLSHPETRELVLGALSARNYERVGAAIAAGGSAPYGLTSEQELIRREFRRFGEARVVPHAEHVHREDALIPADVLTGLAEMGCFGLSIPERFGGLQPDDRPDHMGMVLVTEELSRASLGVAGSLITRPEILAKALLRGGTDAQKAAWLPRLASGATLCAVAVTEPDFGSDVAGLKTAATRVPGGFRVSGQKTWCTFAGYADVLMVLVRTDPDPAAGHRGLSILLVEKPRFGGHDFEAALAQGGRLVGRAIGTLGYRGMHSYDVFFEDVFVPDACLVGGETGLGRGFYLQMEGFSGGRIQTAARATGVMQAALDAAVRYAGERRVFGRPIAEYGLTAVKLARMAMLTQAARQLTYRVARLMDQGEGQMEASLCKLWVSRASEWVTREAMQIHGGMGYAEEYPVSRYFVDARVFSIFEGAEEVLAVRVVARQTLTRWLTQHQAESDAGQADP